MAQGRFVYLPSAAGISGAASFNVKSFKTYRFKSSWGDKRRRRSGSLKDSGPKTLIRLRNGIVLGELEHDSFS